MENLKENFKDNIKDCIDELNSLWKDELGNYSEKLKANVEPRRKKMLTKAAISGFLTGLTSFADVSGSSADRLKSRVNNIKQEMWKDIQEEKEEVLNTIKEKEGVILKKYGFKDREEFFEAVLAKGDSVGAKTGKLLEKAKSVIGGTK